MKTDVNVPSKSNKQKKDRYQNVSGKRTPKFGKTDRISERDFFSHTVDPQSLALRDDDFSYLSVLFSWTKRLQVYLLYFLASIFLLPLVDHYKEFSY